MRPLGSPRRSIWRTPWWPCLGTRSVTAPFCESSSMERATRALVSTLKKEELAPRERNPVQQLQRSTVGWRSQFNMTNRMHLG